MKTDDLSYFNLQTHLKWHFPKKNADGTLELLTKVETPKVVDAPKIDVPKVEAPKAEGTPATPVKKKVVKKIVKKIIKKGEQLTAEA